MRGFGGLLHGHPSRASENPSKSDGATTAQIVRLLPLHWSPLEFQIRRAQEAEPITGGYLRCRRQSALGTSSDWAEVLRHDGGCLSPESPGLRPHSKASEFRKCFLCLLGCAPKWHRPSGTQIPG